MCLDVDGLFFTLITRLTRAAAAAACECVCVFWVRFPFFMRSKGWMFLFFPTKKLETCGFCKANSC